MTGSEQADFFLHVGHGADFDIQLLNQGFEQPERLRDCEGSDAVVKGARDSQIAAQHLKAVIQRDWVTDAHQLQCGILRGDTDVDEELVDLGGFGLAVAAGEVRGDVADHAKNGTLPGVDGDPLGLGDGRVDAASPADMDEALRGDEVHRHGDFIGVGRQHQAGTATFVEHGHAVAIGVGEGLVGVRAGVIQPDAQAAGFVTDRAGGVDECFQESQRLRTHTTDTAAA